MTSESVDRTGRSAIEASSGQRPQRPVSSVSKGLTQGRGVAGHSALDDSGGGGEPHQEYRPAT